MSQENNSKKNVHILGSKFASFGFFASVILFYGGFFCGTKSMDSTALIYSVKQVFIPAVIIGTICYWIGCILDNARKKKIGKKKKTQKVNY